MTGRRLFVSLTEPEVARLWVYDAAHETWFSESGLPRCYAAVGAHLYAAMGAADVKDVERLIHSVGFYHNKAKNIVDCSRVIAEEYGGVVPKDIDALTKLPGVGRKTANVIRGNVYDDPSIVVDTHVKRISNKLGFTTEEDPVKIEFALMKVLPTDHWIIYNIHIITLGRTICIARRPDCANCFLNDLCPSAEAKQS